MLPAFISDIGTTKSLVYSPLNFKSESLYHLKGSAGYSVSEENQDIPMAQCGACGSIVPSIANRVQIRVGLGELLMKC